jgi:pyruvate,water dikinase
MGTSTERLVKTGKEAESDICVFLATGKEKLTDTVQGKAARRGTARGTARIFKASYDNHDTLHLRMTAMKKGEIIIAETTSPEFMPACKKAGAIVTDQGGRLSHAAVVSREFGIPCIVGTNNGTRIIKDGDLVEVDADKGIVRIIEKAPRG